MDSIIDYLDAAKDRQGFKSDRRLAAELGIGVTTMHSIRHGRHCPDDDVMTQLAMLAGADVQAALIDLNIWRAKSPKTKERYRDIKRSLRGTAAAGLIGATVLISSGNSDAGTHAMVESHPPEQVIVM